MNAQERAITIARLADDQKASDIVILNVSEKCNFTDYFVIATCSSPPQLRSLARKVRDKLREMKLRPYRTAGYETTTWIVHDYGDVVVHLFGPETRDYYRLDQLWGDAEKVGWVAAAS